MYTHSNLLQKYNSCRLLLPITHKYLSSHETRKHRHIFARVAPFWQRVFQTLPNLGFHPGVAVYHTLKIFFIVNAKDLLMPHTKFRVCTLKINAIFCHRKKKSHYFWTGVYIHARTHFREKCEAQIRKIKKNGSLFRYKSAKFWKGWSFCMYLPVFFYIESVSIFALSLLCINIFEP